MLVVTHDIEQARRISDAIVYLDNGEIVESGETSQLFSAPRMAATRDYLAGRPQIVEPV